MTPIQLGSQIHNCLDWNVIDEVEDGIVWYHCVLCGRKWSRVEYD